MRPLNVNLDQLIEQIEADLPAADAVTKVGEARSRARALSDLGDQLIDHYVNAARAGGASWSQVGDALGVSKQAAQQRRGMGKFERFTGRARRVVVIAQERARALKHHYIGTEHVLLGLVDEEEGLAAKVITMLGGSRDAVIQAVNAAVTAGSDEPSGHIPFTPQAKKVLDESLVVALDLGHNYIGTEHILLGLLRVPDGLAAQVLSGLGIEYEQARATVEAALMGHQHRGGKRG